MHLRDETHKDHYHWGSDPCVVLTTCDWGKEALAFAGEGRIHTTTCRVR